MNSKINKIQNLIIIFLLICACIFLIFFNALDKTDELWCFQNVCKICNGFQIYKDANIIVTPLFFYIGAIICKIFNSNILGFRLYNIIIYAGLFIIIYKIFEKLKVSKKFIIIFISLILEFVILTMVSNGANYNILAMVFVLYGVYLYVSKKSNNVKQGLIMSLVFLTKQNIGIYYAIATIIYELYKYKFTKKFILNQLKKFIFFSTPIIIFVLLMYIFGNFNNFMSYVFGGLLDFGAKNIKISASALYFFIPFVIIALYVFLCVNKNKVLKEIINEETFDNLTLLFIYSMIMTLNIIPIANSAHFLLIIPLYLIYIFYFFDILLFESIFDDDRYIMGINWVTIIILFILVLRMIVHFFSYDLTFISDKNSHFFGVYTYTKIIEETKDVKQYIIQKNSEGIDVIICSSDAACVMIDLNQSHGAYDLPFNGNLGYNGIERMKEDILSRENTEFLIFTNEEDMFWQEPLEIREVIIDNLNYIGTVSNYSIYSTNK